MKGTCSHNPDDDATVSYRCPNCSNELGPYDSPSGFYCYTCEEYYITPVEDVGEVDV